MNNYVIFVVGPTAIGKTSLAIELANYFKTSILSCDSRQFFKEMKIGTAVPSDDELAAAKHYFIQNKSILEPYNVGDFEREALATLDELFTQNNIQIVVGGSGLYVNAITNGFDEFPEIKKGIRESISQKFNTEGLEYLESELQKHNPTFYNHIKNTNPQTLLNPQRMKRFVEVCISSGKSYSSFLNSETKKRNFIPILIGLEAERETLYNRINLRVDNMVNEGLIEEVEQLIEFKNLNALQTVGYRELFDYFENKITKEVAIEEIKKNTRRFAKRQITWFKRNEAIKWFDFSTNVSNIKNYIQSEIKEA